MEIILHTELYIYSIYSIIHNRVGDSGMNRLAQYLEWIYVLTYVIL